MVRINAEATKIIVTKGLEQTMSQQKLGEKAVSLFLNEYLCSESVLLAMAEFYGIKNNLIPKIATAFGAGFGRKDLSADV
jgi:hypothetical protein